MQIIIGLASFLPLFCYNSVMNLLPFVPGYREAIYTTGRQPAFVMLMAFIITFVITRGYTRLARKYGWGSASINGVHTHHMVFGVILAFVSGGLMFGFTPTNQIVVLFLAAMFGVGVSLVLDEFALVFHLQDVYWEREGRSSIDAVILAVVLGALFLLRITPFGTTPSVTGTVLCSVVAINLSFVIVTALKGKPYVAIFGIFIPVMAMVGSIRLAHPRSVWARHFYRRDRKKARAERRFAAYQRHWHQKKEKAWDLIGGKPGRP